LNYMVFSFWKARAGFFLVLTEKMFYNKLASGQTVRFQTTQETSL
jgi:hypothetical protein